jgi:hypothetical protein
MINFEHKAVSADKVFQGFLLDIYFDEFGGEGNILITTRKELGEWLLRSIRAMATDIATSLDHPSDFEVIGSTVSELIQDLSALHNLPEDVQLILFNDGRVFK